METRAYNISRDPCAFWHLWDLCNAAGCPCGGTARLYHFCWHIPRCVRADGPLAPLPAGASAYELSEPVKAVLAQLADLRAQLVGRAVLLAAAAPGELARHAEVLPVLGDILAARTATPTAEAVAAAEAALTGPAAAQLSHPAAALAAATALQGHCIKRRKPTSRRPSTWIGADGKSGGICKPADSNIACLVKV